MAREDGSPRAARGVRGGERSRGAGRRGMIAGPGAARGSSREWARERARGGARAPRA